MDLRSILRSGKSVTAMIVPVKVGKTMEVHILLVDVYPAPFLPRGPKYLLKEKEDEKVDGTT